MTRTGKHATKEPACGEPHSVPVTGAELRRLREWRGGLDWDKRTDNDSFYRNRFRAAAN